MKNIIEETNLTIIKRIAYYFHSSTNHLYDRHSYDKHLKMVYDYNIKFNYLIAQEDKEIASAACWLHDTIEDCRKTYNDIEKLAGYEVAEIVYALTNEKGRTRKDRANNKYYAGIKAIPLAVFVKICDRLANVSYSKLKNSSILEVYKSENAYFFKKLYLPQFDDMFLELTNLF